jgi:hypothetical protein
MIADTKLMITVHTHTGRPVHVLNCTTQYLVPGTWYLVPVMSKGTRYSNWYQVLMVMLMSEHMQTFMIRYWLCTRCR